MNNSIKGTILVVGLNPAWQKVLKFQTFEKGIVNRASSVSYCAAGKGVNFCRAVKIWNNGVKTKNFLFAGGKTGKLLLNAMDAEGLKYKVVNAHAETRICTTCLSMSDHKMTELIEPSETIAKTAEKEIFNLIFSEASTKNYIALCGTFPPGMNVDFYTKVTQEAKKLEIPVYMDAVQYTDGALAAGVDILKVNEEEIISIGGKKDIKASAKECLKKYPIKVIAVTAGANNAFLFTENIAFEYSIPPIDNFVNPLGAGDTVGAIMLAEISSGKDLFESFAIGLAAGCASCMHDLPAFFEPKNVPRILSKIKKRKII
ncbi:MAG TPA: PfkB family carbohydrate kinase [Victivallales bacterium]|nr:PfkB family carbohydrate kinase [Victivallales bacterium]HPO91274.1 PfkB family carbohydrate kinase [Victivallales bacterium]HRR06349.1 PfkB family carbohydrate kinase [Victivallales bacterium]HRR28703.1 PfkB family carbohydrate kinase [Victivallales bacterium]HRU00929.1 PfkB family carbohydrate kinase [Victivallales bacterium]